MPYIKSEDKMRIHAQHLDMGPTIDLSQIKSTGDVAYATYLIMKSFYEKEFKSHENLVRAFGAGQNGVDEFKKRFVDPHEALKLEENGDV